MNQKRVEAIREWTPLGAYEIVYGKYDVKMRVGLRERVGMSGKQLIIFHYLMVYLPNCRYLRY